MQRASASGAAAAANGTGGVLVLWRTLAILREVIVDWPYGVEVVWAGVVGEGCLEGVFGNRGLERGREGWGRQGGDPGGFCAASGGEDDGGFTAGDEGEDEEVSGCSGKGD